MVFNSHRLFYFLALAFAAAAENAATDAPQPPIESIEAVLAARIDGSITEVESEFFNDVRLRAQIKHPDVPGIVGRDGWYMSKKATDALFSGTRWSSMEESWHSRLIEPNAVNAIVAYNEALRVRGIDLILVPSLSKLFFYPDELLDADSYGELDESVRLDRKYFEIFELLRERGVEVLDLYPGLKKAMRDSGAPMYRPDDGHWSGFGNREAAKLIYERLKDYEFVDEVPKRDYIVKEYSVSLWSEPLDPLTGRLIGKGVGLGSPETTPNAIAVRELRKDGSATNHAPWRQSPILLMGDSFVLAMSIGRDPFGAGVRDHISQLLRFPIDTLCVYGGGANGVRVELAIDDGRLDDKKVVLWSFSTTNLPYVTGEDGWKIIPLPKPLSE